MLNRRLNLCRMRCLIMSVISVFFLGCATERGTVKDLTLSMVLLNQGQPFVSREFAERLAFLVIDEKYPKDIFLVRRPASIEDKGKNWEVTVSNELIDPKDSLPRVGKKIVPKYLTITIRKENCEIVSVS